MSKASKAARKAALLILVGKPVPPTYRVVPCNRKQRRILAREAQRRAAAPRKGVK